MQPVRLCEQDRKGWKSTDRCCDVTLHLDEITPREIHMENVQNLHYFVSDNDLKITHCLFKVIGVETVISSVSIQAKLHHWQTKIVLKRGAKCKESNQTL